MKKRVWLVVMAKRWGALRNESKENISILWKSTMQGKQHFQRMVYWCASDSMPCWLAPEEEHKGRQVSCVAPVLLTGKTFVWSSASGTLQQFSLFPDLQWTLSETSVCGWRKLIGLSMGGWWAVPMLRRTGKQEDGYVRFFDPKNNYES